MDYLLDTNIWSYMQEGNQVVASQIAQLPDQATLFMSAVTQGELLGGIQLVDNPSRRSQLVTMYEQVVSDATEILPVDQKVAERYAEIYAMLRRKGRPIESNDMWIAATALADGLVLVSSDQHFRFVDGLQVEDWTKPIL